MATRARQAVARVDGRALRLERTGSVPSFEGDDMLQAELSKIEGWLMMGEVSSLMTRARARSQQRRREIPLRHADVAVLALYGRCARSSRPTASCVGGARGRWPTAAAPRTLAAGMAFLSRRYRRRSRGRAA